MRLMLMRHARPEEKDPSRYPDDRTRPLSAAGRKEHLAFSKTLRRMGISADVVVSSPFIRAAETAEITARGLGLKGEISLDERLGGEFSVDSAFGLLAERAKSGSILLVGHAPDLSELAAAALGQRRELKAPFPKGGVMGIEFEGAARPGKGRLLFFYDPGQLLQALP